jgi:hypothetical protein
MPVLFLSGLKQSGCEANHSLPSGASVRNQWILYNQPDATYTMFFIIIGAVHV